MTRSIIRRVDKDHIQQISRQNPDVTVWNGVEHRQSSRLVTLPPELLLEIVSVFPKVPAFVDLVVGRLEVEDVYKDRPDALRALSQTCRTLRRFFLPLYWECLNVCTNRFGGATHLHLATSLEAKSIGLCNRPDLADFVRVANIVLTKSTLETLLPEFGRCLAKLRNLHTLQLIHTCLTLPSFTGRYLPTLGFPSLRTVILPAHAHDFLRQCPGVRTVVCTDGDANKLVLALRRGEGKVEVLKGFFVDVEHMADLARYAPNLRHIEIAEDMSQRYIKPGQDMAKVRDDVIKILRKFRNLSKVDIVRLTYPPRLHWTNPKRLPDMVESVRDVLRTSPSNDKKALRVIMRCAYEPDEGSRFAYHRSRQTGLEEVAI